MIKNWRAVFIIPGNSLDTPSREGYFGQKFDFIYEGFLKSGWEVRVFTDLYTKEATFRTKYKIEPLTPLFVLNIVRVLLMNPLRLFRAKRKLSFINQSALGATYKATLVRLAPDVILTIGASESLVLACRESQIPCVEIQHGMFEQTDMSTYWPNGVCPDLFATWDSRSARIAEEAGIKSWVLGYPNLNGNRDQAILSGVPGRQVCVSLGYGAADSEDPWGCFPRSLARAIDSLIEANLPIAIRLHPLQSVRAIKAFLITIWIRLRFKRVKIENPRKIPLKESIENAICNLTFLSASWYDFALAGKATFLLDEAAATRYKGYADELGIWKSRNSPVYFMESQLSLLAFVRLNHKIEEQLEDFSIQSLSQFIESLKSYKS